MSLEAIPSELKENVLSFCDYQSLGAFQCVSKKCWRIASSDNLWRPLFKSHFHEEMPQIMQCKEAFKKRTLPILLDNRDQLEQVVTSFFCDLKWNTKRHLIGLFPKESSYSLNVQQSFGTERGTEEGFKGLADEVVYYQFMGDLSPRQHADTEYIFQQFTHCPKNSSVEKKIPKTPLSMTYHSNTAKHLVEQWPYLPNPLYPISGFVDNVNMDEGNTLGYFSEINDWKSPFKLHYSSENSGAPLWVGLFPINADFKFVQINAIGEIKWELGTNDEDGNRNLSPHSRYDACGCYALKESLRSYPIIFDT